MFSRPWFSLLRRQILIHRRALAFVLTVAAVLLGWSAFVSRPPVLVAPAPTAIGEPVLDSGWVRVPVRFADGEMAGLLRADQRIQLWGSDARTQQSRLIVPAARVVSVPAAPSIGLSGGRASRVVVVAVPVTDVGKLTTVNAFGLLAYVLDH